MIRIKKSTKNKVYEFYIENKKKHYVKLSNYGITIMEVHIEDKNSKNIDVILGFDNIEDYIDNKNTFYFGATCGRFANRIKEGKFKIGDTLYQCDINDNNKNLLHGGKEGFSFKIFEVVNLDLTQNEINGNEIIFKYVSPDNEMGFPGQLEFVVKVSFNDEDTLTINYEAISTKDTVINFTNHMYHNLCGQNSNNNILSHKLKLNCDRFIPLDEFFIPIGYSVSVKNSPFDFRDFNFIGEKIDADDRQLKYANGYDHSFIVNDYNKKLNNVAELLSEDSGIKLTVMSDLPGVQLYTGNFITKCKGKKSAIYDFRSGVCLETEFFPDYPNIKAFNFGILKSGEKFSSVSKYIWTIV